MSPAAGPWKSKEKQSRLIHTAPVHAPTGEAGLPTPARGEAPAAGVAGRSRGRSVEGAAAGGGARGEGSGDEGSAGTGATGTLSWDAVEQLRTLEAAYAAAQRRTAYQKDKAVRWIKRQSARMLVQVS